MKILECFTAAKSGKPEDNEDVVLVTPDFVGVFDGSSLAMGERLEGMSGGRFAAVRLAEAASKMPADITAADAVAFLTEAFNSSLKHAASKAGIDPAKSLAASGMTLYSKHRREIWSIADCPFRVDDVEYTTTLSMAKLRAEVRQICIRDEIELGKTEAELLENDPTPHVIAQGIMRYSKGYANVSDEPLGYGVLNGTQVPEKHVTVLHVKDAQEIVIASDGYPRVLPTLAETEAYLSKVIVEDPLCYKVNPQPKAVVKGQCRYDDTSYIRFRT